MSPNALRRLDYKTFTFYSQHPWQDLNLATFRVETGYSILAELQGHVNTIITPHTIYIVGKVRTNPTLTHHKLNYRSNLIVN